MSGEVREYPATENGRESAWQVRAAPGRSA